ncbi:MAG: hypothetical protein ACI4D8_08470 [Wujia sp.]
MRIKRNRYYFTDTSIALDTVIAFIMGGLSLLIELVGIVASFVTRGHVHEIFGTLYLCAILMTLVGIIFGRLAYKEEEGGVRSKRLSVALNILSVIILVWIIVLGIR